MLSFSILLTLIGYVFNGVPLEHVLVGGQHGVVGAVGGSFVAGGVVVHGVVPLVVPRLVLPGRAAGEGGRRRQQQQEEEEEDGSC